MLQGGGNRRLLKLSYDNQFHDTVINIARVLQIISTKGLSINDFRVLHAPPGVYVYQLPGLYACLQLPG